MFNRRRRRTTNRTRSTGSTASRSVRGKHSSGALKYVLIAAAALLVIALAVFGITRLVRGHKSTADAAGDPAATAEPLRGMEETAEPTEQPQELWVRFIDVGQADSALIECGGEYMLIDGGNAEDSQLIYTTLKNLGVNKLKYIVGTHPDEDHIGGLAGALNFATAETAFCSVTEYDTRAFASFVKYLNQQGVSITVPNPGDTYTLGTASFTILGPLQEAEDSNNNSLVILLTIGEKRFLFTGDAEAEEEADLLAKYSSADLRADVLKVGHHGSRSSTTQEFLDAVNPEIAVISVGANNDYGHPKAQILERLRDKGVTLYRTDLQGDVTITTDGKTLDVQTAKTTSEDVYTYTYAYNEETAAPTDAAENGGAESNAESAAAEESPAPEPTATPKPVMN